MSDAIRIRGWRALALAAGLITVLACPSWAAKDGAADSNKVFGEKPDVVAKNLKTLAQLSRTGSLRSLAAASRASRGGRLLGMAPRVGRVADVTAKTKKR